MKFLSNKVALAMSFSLGILACSPKLTTEEYLTQAQIFSEKRDHGSAIIALKNAVRLEPKSPNVRFDLGATYLAQGDYSSAEKELEKAEKLGSDNALLMTKLVQVKVKLNKFDYVYQLIEQVDRFEDVDQVMLLTYAGIAAINQNKTQLAKEYIEDAISISDDSIYGQIGQAYVSHSSNNYKEGLATVNELLANKPDFEEAVLLKGYILQASEQFDAAAKVFEQYAKLRPKDIQVKFFIAQNYVFAQLFDVAEPHVDLLLKMSANHPLANQLKAQIEYSRENFKSAMEYAVISFQQSDGFHISKIVAGISAYKLQDYEQSYHYLISVKGILPPQHIVRKLIIDLQLRLGYEVEAAFELQSLAELDAVDSAILTMASNQLLDSGNIGAAQDLLRSSMASKEQKPIDFAKQGVTQLRLNQTAQGIARLEQALKLDPELNFAEQGLAAGYLTNSRFSEALAIAQKWQANDEQKVQGLLLESLVLDKQNKLTKAKKLLNQVLALDSKNVGALYKLATYAHEDKNTELAFDYYTQVLKQQPQHIRAMINFTRLIANSTNENKEFINRATEFYSTLLVSQPENNSVKLGLAYLNRIDKNNENALVLLKEIANSEAPLKGIEILLGDSYKEQKNWRAALAEYKKYVDNNPKSLSGTQKILSIYEQAGQFDKALQHINSMLKINKNNAGLLLLKVYYQSILAIEISKADLEIITVDSGTANHWLFDKTLGNIAYNKKNFHDSVKFYASAYSKERNYVNLVNWSKSVALNGNKKKAIDILEDYAKDLSEGQQRIRVQTMLAGAYINSNNSTKAIVLYESILKTNPNVVIALNNLSHLELQKGNVKKALSYAKQAVVLEDQNVIMIDTYANALAANQQFDLALEQYDKAISIDNSNVELSINKAKLLMLVNQSDLAKSLLISIKTEVVEEQKRINELLLNL